VNHNNLISLFEDALKGIDQTTLEEIGTVVQVGDKMCTIHGLKDAFLGELILFEGGNKGIIFELSTDLVSAFIMYTTISVSEEESVSRSGKVFSIPVGEAMLSRVINIQGEPIDMLGAIQTSQTRSIEQSIPSVVERKPIDEPLETGTIAVDALIPIGKGQRQLIIGGRGTGKTTFILDTILHQKNLDTICIYVAIGQRQASIARLTQTLAAHGALEYCIVVSASADETVLNRYLAPYVGATIAEYFRDQKKDVLIVYDDLSNHAISFREMSLLLRRAPGREAYPGDVFYLHSRLLERAGKLLSGGSITAFPIVQIQGDDITSYIPTNVISITDGQIFFDTQKFNQSIFPAINTELSVSRVGGAAQTKAIKKMTKALRLELAQYHELLAFSQFGAELDDIAKRQLERGKRLVTLFQQQKQQTYSLVEEVLILFLFRDKVLDTISVDQITPFKNQFISYAQSVFPKVCKDIADQMDITDNTYQQLQHIAQEFKVAFIAPK
jgi:F-type H+/Na+-transporting ATPase subunit alpha